MAKTSLEHRGAPVPHRATRRLVAANLAAFAPVGLIIWANSQGPERWWPATINLYAPQWIWAIPFLALIPATYRRRKWLTVLPFVGLAAVTGPVMGFCIPKQRGAPAAAPRLRVMTFNVNQLAGEKVMAEIRRVDPDVLFLQEARSHSQAFLEALPAYAKVENDDCLILSRYPLGRRMAGLLPAGSFGSRWVGSRMRFGGQEVAVYSVHLETPRRGINAVLSRARDGIPRLQEQTRVRIEAAGMFARQLAQETGPTVVGGDLNAPQPSLVLRVLGEASLRDACSTAGWGFGFTYGQRMWLRHSFVRLDHVLVSPEWHVTGCRTGRDGGSDHRPVVAELALRTG